MAGEAGHTFLAKLGKRRLRPGGKKATDWLMAHGRFTADKQVLEVACNMGTTTVELAKAFGCPITGIDLDDKALALAKETVARQGLSELITFRKANAMKLPFDDDSFDIIVNEAMLTMQTDKGKIKCLQEYLRVLKPGGLLLTHDVMLKRDSQTLVNELSRAIHVHVQPLTHTGWEGLFESQGFSDIETLAGEMSLMTPKGMIYDEGLLGTFKIIKNALKAENRPQFLQMFKMFKANQKRLGFIACVSRKPD